MATLLMNRPADHETVLAIEFASYFRECGALPRTGGVMDQDYYFMFMIRAGLNALAKKDEQEQKKASRK